MKFRRGPETEKIRSALLKLAEGEELTISTLNTQLGFDVTLYDKNVYRTRETLRNEGFGVITFAAGVLRRLTAAEIVNQTAVIYLNRARGAGRRGRSALVTTDYDKLSDADKRAHNIKLANFGALAIASTLSTGKKLMEFANARTMERQALKMFENLK